MITYQHLNIATVTEGVVVHGVNCQGVMNSGVAKDIRHQWPEAYESYYAMVTTCPAPLKLLGSIDVCQISDELYVVNLFSQEYYGTRKSKYASPTAIRLGLQKVIDGLNPPTIFIPRIGCGLGGLDWESDVLPIIEDLSANHSDINFIVCEWK